MSIMSSENSFDQSSQGPCQNSNLDCVDKQRNVFEADINALDEILLLVKSETSVTPEFTELFGSYLKGHVDAFLEKPNCYTRTLLGMSFKVCSELLQKDKTFSSTILERESLHPKLCQSIDGFLRIHPIPSDDLLEAACFILKKMVTTSDQNATFVSQKGFVNTLLSCILHQSPSLRSEAMNVIRVIYRLPGAVIDYTKLVKTSYRFLHLELQCQSTNEKSERCILLALDMIEFGVQQLRSLAIDDENRFYQDMSSLSVKLPHLADRIAASLSNIRNACRIRRQIDLDNRAPNPEQKLVLPRPVSCNSFPVNVKRASPREEKKQTTHNSQFAQDSCTANISHTYPEVAPPSPKTPILSSFPHNDTSRPHTYRRGAKVSLTSDQCNDIQFATKLDDITSFAVAKVICGMLNADQGGSIWFGFRQESGTHVDGIHITRDQRDAFRMGFHRVLTNISPLPLLSAFTVNFTQIEILVGREVANNTEHYVVEIRVPKDLNLVYTTSDRKLNKCVYVRRGCNTEILSKNAVRSLVARKEVETYQNYIRTMERLLVAT